MIFGRHHEPAVTGPYDLQTGELADKFRSSLSRYQGQGHLRRQVERLANLGLLNGQAGGIGVKSGV